MTSAAGKLVRIQPPPLRSVVGREWSGIVSLALPALFLKGI